jgi:hypothetical protein
MKITIARSDSPDALNHETLILGIFSDERPPKGYGGRVDWRLNGMISGELAAGRVSGGFREKSAFAFPTRIRVSRLILFGLGALGELTYERLYGAGYDMALTAAGLGATDVALPIPAAGRGRLPLSGTSEALFTGLYDGFMRAPQRMEALRLDIPARPDQVAEIRRGLDRFRHQAGDARVWVLDSGEGDAGGGDLCAIRRYGEGLEAVRT